MSGYYPENVTDKDIDAVFGTHAECSGCGEALKGGAVYIDEDENLVCANCVATAAEEALLANRYRVQAAGFDSSGNLILRVIDKEQ